MTPTPDLVDAYYARVLPLYGDTLNGKTLGVIGHERCLEVALLLARCGVKRFSAGPLTEALRSKLREQNPWEQRFEFHEFQNADVIFCGPGAAQTVVVRSAIRLSYPEGSTVRARLDLLNAGTVCESIPSNWPKNPFDCADILNQSAAMVRDVLLNGDTAKDSVVLMGHERWPWWKRTYDRNDADRVLLDPAVEAMKSVAAVRRGKILIVGCGSLGSVAAIRLAPLVETLVLCDPERVAVENPVRQAFSIEDIGQFKAEALARRCCRFGAKARGIVRLEEDSENGARAFEALIEIEEPDLVILTTGTAAEFMAASVLRRRKIAHVAARCYARARYFEIIAVDGARGPCFHCLREQLHMGSSPSLTPEQKARYDPDYRPGELNAEPATILESGRCADVLARIAFELMKCDAERPDWLRKTLLQSRNCFIGSNHAEQDESGRWAYGLHAPGKVTTYGAEDIAGARSGDYCSECGRAVG
jgi:hypothetical protein